MMENDDKLIEQFLSPGRREIADNGFSNRVMRNLPERKPLLISEVLNVLGFVLAAVLFISLDGLQITKETVVEFIDTVAEHGAEMQVDIHSLAIVVIVLLFLAYKKIESLV